MGSACGNICTGSAKEQELNIESLDGKLAITEKAGNTRNNELESEFFFMTQQRIEYPNSSVKV